MRCCIGSRAGRKGGHAVKRGIGDALKCTPSFGGCAYGCQWVAAGVTWSGVGHKAIHATRAAAAAAVLLAALQRRCSDRHKCQISTAAASSTEDA